ncbi:MAG: Na+/H+ antiporter NhaC family protein [Eubacteriales bacterium]|nr:Na+/H+ antiporter NhaC family protein [Eubacteriales bacterium]
MQVMMELFTLGLFCAGLLISLLLRLPVLCALGAGLALFWLYGLRKGFSFRELLQMSLEGISGAKNILLTFFLIGIMTALWRAAGTIPVIVSCSVTLVRPSVLFLMSFLLCSAVSFLTGTSFGTAATIGVICAAIARSLGADPRMAGGAVLAGAFFGDRCSPVSTSALLVAEVTKTDIFENIRNMMKTAFLPFILSGAGHLALGLFYAPGSGNIPDLAAVFAREFVLHPAALIPAAVILLLSLLHVSVKPAMAASILCAVPLALILQHADPAALFSACLFGFRAGDPEVSAMISGGGIVSMLRVSGIVCLSSSYAGIFRKTGLLGGVRSAVKTLAARSSPFCAVLFTSLAAGMIACNQTLTIMLTAQLCEEVMPDRRKLALDLEDTAVVLAPLVPWSIAGSVPLASAGAPLTAIFFAWYLYLLPACRLLRDRLIKDRS